MSTVPTDLPPGYLEADRGWQLMSVAIAFLILETVFVAGVFISRYVNEAPHSWDSYLLIPAYIFCMSECVVDFILVIYCGGGKHVLAVTAGEFSNFLKTEFAAEFLYVPSTALPKLSVICLYYRIFAKPSYRYCAVALAVIQVLYMATAISLSLGACQPIQFNWDKEIADGYCMNLMAVYEWISIPGMVTDVVILLLPIPLIWKLHTSSATKVGLTLTFLMASIGMVTGIVRFVAFFTTDLFSDPTWYCVETMTWNTVEPGIYLVAACLPSLRPLVRVVCRDVEMSSLRSRLLGYGHRVFRTSSGGRSAASGGGGGGGGVSSAGKSAGRSANGGGGGVDGYDVRLTGLDNSINTRVEGGRGGFKKLDDDGYSSESLATDAESRRSRELREEATAAAAATAEARRAANGIYVRQEYKQQERTIGA